MKEILFIIVKGFQVTLFVLLFLPLQSTALAERPQDSFKILTLHEQGLLVPAVSQYNSKILELNQDRLNLVKDKEWVNVKVMHIQDQNRMVPLELKEAVGVLDYKMQLIDKEIVRLDNLNRKHIDSLLKLDLEVKEKYGNKPPEWWHFDAWVLELLYPGHKPVGDNKKTASVGNRGNPGLVRDLQAKIKEVELGNWVELNSEDSRLRLEVQLPILFGSGKSTIAEEYKKFFRKLAWLLKPYPVQIEVAGFTDGDVVSDGKFSTSIELGVNRATNVVKELVETGLKQSAFKIISQGVKPGKNEDKLSAAMKRRVEVNVFFDDNEA